MSIASEIISNLRRILTEGGDGNFLVLSCGDYYVQFAGEPGATTLHCEAVSQAYLSDEHMLPSGAGQHLEALGFGQDDSNANFYRIYEVTSDDVLDEIASATLSIFEKVYGCGSQPDFEQEIELGDVEFPDNPDLEAAISELVRTENEDTHYSLLSALADAVLIVPVGDDEPLLIEDEAGQSAIPVFTNRLEQLAWAPGDCVFRPTAGSDLLIWAHEKSMPGIVFNPSGDNPLLLPQEAIGEMAAFYRQILEED